MPKLKSNKIILSCVFVTILIDMLGISILIPIYPQLSSIIFTNNHTDSYFIVAWLVSIYSFAQFIFSPILGQLSDKYGRRRILIFSISITAFSYLLFAYGLYTANLPLLFVARVIDGASGGNISIASSVIGDISNNENRPKNFALVGIAIGLGFVLGPVVGGVLSHHFNILTPFYLTALLAFANLSFVAKYLPETNHNINQSKLNPYKSISNIYQAFTVRRFFCLILVLFMFNLGFALFSMFWPIVLQEKFSYDSSQIGIFFGYLGLMILLSQGMFVRRLSGKVQDYKVIFVALAMVSLAIFGFSHVTLHSLDWMYMYSFILALGVALCKSFSSSLIARITPSNQLGVTMGINYSWIALASSMPPLLIYYISLSLANIIMLSYILIVLGLIIYIATYKVIIGSEHHP